jgi:hypothetical protein
MLNFFIKMTTRILALSRTHLMLGPVKLGVHII